MKTYEITKRFKKKKKNSNPLPNNTKIANLCITSFKNQLKLLIRRFSDNREVIYKENRFSHQNKTGVILNYSVLWDPKKIQILYYPFNIEQNMRLLTSRNINFKNLHKQIANHEYGHILSASSVYDLLPNEIRDIDLFNLNPGEDVNFNHSPIEKELINVNVNRLVYILFEFLANYNVYNHIDKRLSSDYINYTKENINSMYNPSKIRHFFYTKNKLNNKMDKGFDRIFLFQMASLNYYIFGSWSSFLQICKKFRNLNVLNFIKIFNDLYYDIVKKFGNLSDMKEFLINSSKEIDKIEFEELVIRNNITEVTKEILESIRCKLK